MNVIRVVVFGIGLMYHGFGESVVIILEFGWRLFRSGGNSGLLGRLCRKSGVWRRGIR